MSKRHSLMDPTQPSSSKQSKPPPSTNWDICVLCQVVTDEPLQCPLRNKRKQSVGSGYVSLAEDLQFRTLQHMPMDLNLEQLDDGDGMEFTLKRHKAKWHKRCRLKLNKKAFDELSRGKVTTAQQNTLSLHTRSAHSHSPSTEPTCFFCNEPAARSSGFHNASTYNIDRNVRKCALELEDTALLVKLAEGDMISIEAKYQVTTVCLHCTTEPGRLHLNEMMEMILVYMA